MIFYPFVQIQWPWKMHAIYNVLKTFWWLIAKKLTLIVTFNAFVLLNEIKSLYRYLLKADLLVQYPPKATVQIISNQWLNFTIARMLSMLCFLVLIQLTLHLTTQQDKSV